MLKWKDKIFAWASLVRLANGFTAISNILSAFTIVYLTINKTIGLPIFLIFSTLFLYYAGMILNDVYDYEEDRLLRPERVLVQKRVNWYHARSAGYAFLFAGVIFAAFNGTLSFLISLILASSIVVYDRLRLSGMVAAAIMGFCRYLNWLLGLSIFFKNYILIDWSILSETIHLLFIPVPVFFYVMSLTVLSKVEARADKRWPLWVCISGLIITCAVFWIMFYAGILTSLPAVILYSFWIFYLIFKLTKLNQSFRPAKIKRMISFLVLGITALDLILVLAVAGITPSSIVFSIAIGLLLIPAKILSKMFTVT